MHLNTFSRVTELIRGLLEITLETVEDATPAFFATSFIVTVLRFFHSVHSYLTEHIRLV